MPVIHSIYGENIIINDHEFNHEKWEVRASDSKSISTLECGANLSATELGGRLLGVFPCYRPSVAH